MARRTTGVRARNRRADESAVVVGFSPARLQAARERRHMSRGMLAEAIGHRASDVEAWETGQAPVREFTLRLLCYGMGVRPECLIDPPEGDGAGV